MSAGDRRSSFSSKQAHGFASSLCRKIDESIKVVNNNLQQARERMKTTYDKRNSSHKLLVGDFVMLWWPYTTKGISRAFQPKWKGPYQIIRIISNTNCTIRLDQGETKNVHLNQLKKVEKRGEYGSSLVSELTSNAPESVGELFDELTVEEDIVEYNDNPLNDDRLCGLDDRNVIVSRMRSGNIGVGDG